MRGNGAHEQNGGGRFRVPFLQIPRKFPRIPLMAVDPRRLLLVTGMIGCLGLATVSASAAGRDTGQQSAEAVTASAMVADRAGAEKPASRSLTRPTVPKRKSASLPGKAKILATPKAKAKAKPKAAPRKAPARVAPVAGLTPAQMNNAMHIVNTGRSLKLPKRAMIVAISTAMQESNLYNLASDVLPESTRYTNEGSGSDHDSVGLFQQRPSSGWGTVRNLMKPSYAATQFYNALSNVYGWQSMSVTRAAQTVQVSAYPDAYAKHEWRATMVVNALY